MFNLSKKSIVLFLALIAVATAIGWFLVREAKKTGDSLDKIGFVPVQIFKKPVDDTDLLDTSKWKTYRNEEYGFELKYPEGSQMTFGKNEINQQVAGDLFRVFYIDINNGEYVINIGIYKNHSSLNPQIISKNILHTGDITQYKKIFSNLKQQTFYQIDIDNNQRASAIGGIIYGQKQPYFFSVNTVNYTGLSKKALKVVNKVLVDFRFL